MGKRRKKDTETDSSCMIIEETDPLELDIQEEQDPLLQLEPIPERTKNKCLICSRDLTPRSESEVDELATVRLLCQLFKILKLSPAICRFLLVDSLPAPTVLYCTSCEQTISSCIKISQEIDQLRNTLEQLTSKVKDDFIEGFYCRPDVDCNADDNAKANANIRKTLVQCWTTCRVQINKIPEHPSSLSKNRKSQQTSDSEQIPRQDASFHISRSTESSGGPFPEIDCSGVKMDEGESRGDCVNQPINHDYFDDNDNNDDNYEHEAAPLSPSPILSEDDQVQDKVKDHVQNHVQAPDSIPVILVTPIIMLKSLPVPQIIDVPARDEISMIDHTDKDAEKEVEIISDTSKVKSNRHRPRRPRERKQILACRKDSDDQGQPQDQDQGQGQGDSPRRSLRSRVSKRIPTYKIDSDDDDDGDDIGNVSDTGSVYIPETGTQSDSVPNKNLNSDSPTQKQDHETTHKEINFIFPEIISKLKKRKRKSRKTSKTKSRRNNSSNSNPLEAKRRKQEFPFTCTKCGSGFRREKGLELHMKYHGGDGAELMCNQCNAKFSRMTQLKQHQKQHQKVKRGILCLFKTDRRSKVVAFLCNYCQVTYNREQFLIEQGSDKLKISCDQEGCPKIFSNFIIFSYHHDKTCLEKSRLIAEDPKNNLGNRGIVRKYLKDNERVASDSEADLHSCPRCGKKFRQVSNLQRHISLTCHSLSKEEQESIKSNSCHKCNVCKKKYDLKLEFNAAGQRVFHCVFDDCFRWHPTVNSYYKHHATHHQYDKILSTCEVCNKEFTYLGTSFLTHEGVRRFKCDFDFCQKDFGKFQLLFRHHMSHHREFGLGAPPKGTLTNKTFDHSSLVCKYCHKVFKSHHTRRTHEVAKHTKEFKYYCEICGMGRPNLGRLREHVQSHSQERPYKCELCPKTFKKPFDLKSHMNKHNNLRPYMCELCGKAYHNANVLGMHKKQSHKNRTN